MREQERTPKKEATAFLQPHHFCHSLFVRSEVLGPVHSHGRGLCKGMNTRREGSLGAIFKADTVSPLSCIFCSNSSPWSCHLPILKELSVFCFLYTFHLGDFLLLITSGLEVKYLATILTPLASVGALGPCVCSSQLEFVLSDCPDYNLLVCGFPLSNTVSGTK